MLNTLGKRLKCCRISAGLTTFELVEKIKNLKGSLATNTYTRWEADENFPRQKLVEIDLICDVFNEHGLQVASDWILYGEGYPPKLIPTVNISDAELFYRNAMELERTNGWLAGQASGSFGEPFISIGELFILSETKNVTDLHGKLARLLTKDGAKLGKIDILNDKKLKIINRDEEIINVDDLLDARQVKWIRKN